MTTEELTRSDRTLGATLEQVLIQGDLSPLTPTDRVRYYKAVCESIGVNPLTKPFEYLAFQGRLQLYARKDCTDQLRSLHAVSVVDVKPQQIGDLYVVTVQASDGENRTDMATGAVNIKGLGGEALANAMMKAETKAKRRVTLSLCGLGMLDESEVPDTPGAQVIDVDPTTGEVKGTLPEAIPAESPIITEPQVKRLSAIATGAKWSDEQLHEFLSGYGYNSRKEIRERDYVAIVDRLKKGPKG